VFYPAVLRDFIKTATSRSPNKRRLAQRFFHNKLSLNPCKGVLKFFAYSLKIINSLPALTWVSITRVCDFADRIVLTITNTFHAAPAFIKINPRFIFDALSDNGIVRTILLHKTRVTGLANIRLYNRSFHKLLTLTLQFKRSDEGVVPCEIILK